MMAMLQMYGIQHTGRHHSGIDDVINIAEILKAYIRSGGQVLESDLRHFREPKKGKGKGKGGKKN